MASHCSPARETLERWAHCISPRRPSGPSVSSRNRTLDGPGDAATACRSWCPLAKLMQIESTLFTKLRLSRFHIVANDKCIGCYECSRYCQVGIPVMQYALKQEPLDNGTSSCIGCGICVTVCPMDTLSLSSTPAAPQAFAA